MTAQALTDSVVTQETRDALPHEAVVYAFPLYEMSRMRAATSPRVCSAGPASSDPASPVRWCNVLVHARQLITPGRSRVVTPNNDTLYSNAWLDLGDEALVIDLPDTAGRYYVLGLLDFFTNPFASLGQRTTGTAARSFLLTGPGWRGTVPAEFFVAGAHVPCPTPWVWMIGRLLVDGPADMPAVHGLQDAMRLRTLSAWQAGSDEAGTPKRFDPQCDPKAPLEATRFAQVVGRALRDNPPPADERAWQARWEQTDLTDAPIQPEQLAALQRALDAIEPWLRAQCLGDQDHTGWQTMPLLGASFGADYRLRARVALKYIGALESREATYPMAYVDSEGRSLSGQYAYVLRFAPNQSPPVEAFWSLTMYGSHDFMLVDNPIARYAIGDRTPGLQKDADGGLTLCIQHAAPDNTHALANWLPAPEGDFYLCLRAYVPRAVMLDGRYQLPMLERQLNLRQGTAS
ncbi:MAG: DUF1254 domain-containing protein [Rhodoferax sp.]|nr:DUF1254 domain-containing protein [Rhodoferax sp.]